VIGSYLAAQYLRVWRPRRRGQQTAHIPHTPPERSADIEVARTPANALA
jgi:hypothetical protein